MFVLQDINIFCIYVVSVEEQQNDQQGPALQPRQAVRPRQSVRVLAVLPVVAAVALASKLCPELRRLRLVQLSGDLRPPVLAADGVGEGVQVQVNIAVRVSALAAAVETTQMLAAQLCCHGNVKEVLTQGVLQIHRQVGAAALWVEGGGSHKKKESEQVEI